MVPLAKILRILFILFIVYLITEIVRKLLGGSLGIQELVIALLVANLGYSFHMNSRISEINSKVSEHLGWHSGKKASG